MNFLSGLVLSSLPFISFIIVFLTLNGFASRSGLGNKAWHASFLQTAILHGIFIAISAEILSLFHWLTRPGLALCWCIWIAFWGWHGLHQGIMSSGWRKIRQEAYRPEPSEWVFLSLLGLVSGLLLLVALISPPNTTDSLLYHMSRVVHWAQNRSLAHYPTGYRHQLYNPIWAEVAILHFRLLWGNDRLANLVQYGSMLGSLVGVAGIAALICYNRKALWAAVAFAASIPIGVLQATSTQNDYATALWLVSLAYFVLLGNRQKLTDLEKLSLYGACGLALLTKGTAYPYVLPLLLWYFLSPHIRRSIQSLIKEGIHLGSTILVLNAGLWLRNWITSGTPLGPSDWVETGVAAGIGPLKIAANLIRNLVMNFVTPNDQVNSRIVAWLQTTFGSVDPQLASFNMIWNWNHEDLAGNPLQVLLMAISLIVLIAGFRSMVNRSALEYGLVSFLSFTAMSAIVHTETYGLRFQLPFWVLWAPVFGCTLGWIFKRRALVILAILLLSTALPWTIFNKTRPLIAMRDHAEPLTIPCRWLGCTAIGSILLEPAHTVLFANWLDLRSDYHNAVNAIRQTGCRQIGLRLDSSHLEYPLWWLLEAPNNELRIETIFTYSELERYLDLDFKPCALICTICGAKSELNGLILSGEFGIIRIYQGTDFQWNPD